MQVVIIEKKIFEDLLSNIDVFIQKFEKTFERPKQIGEWLDTQDVCLMLNISKRTVQSLKSSGKLPFTLICRKSYFKLDDIEKLLHNGNDRSQHG